MKMCVYFASWDIVKYEWNIMQFIISEKLMDTIRINDYSDMIKINFDN
jgi:hypothetical protein